MCMRYEIVASRGRWIDNKWTQQYEFNCERISNTLTGVFKDNLLLEIYDIRCENCDASQD